MSDKHTAPPSAPHPDDGDPATGGQSPSGARPGAGDKPAILQDQEFTVEEGILYRVCRTGAIWMNKLFFSCLFLLFVWFVLGISGVVEPGSADSLELIEDPETGEVVEQEAELESVFLSTTALYLGAMTVFSFLASIGFGLLGLVVGKNVIAITPTEDEVGAQGQPGAVGPTDATVPRGQEKDDQP